MTNEIFKTNGEFLTLKTSPYRPYFYVERKGRDSVGFILVDKNKTEKKYGLICERKPPLDELYGGEAFLTTAFGGSNDTVPIAEYSKMTLSNAIEHMKSIVQTEALEEAGYSVPLEKIVFVSREFVSTQMNQFCYLFLVVVTDIQIGNKQPQNEIEAQSSISWLDEDGVFSTNDWKSKLLVMSDYLLD